MIAAHDRTRFVDEQRPVRVAVEGDADDPLLAVVDQRAHRRCSARRSVAPHADVDARAVVLAVDFRHGRAELAQRVRRDRVGCAVSRRRRRRSGRAGRRRRRRALRSSGAPRFCATRAVPTSVPVGRGRSSRTDASSSISSSNASESLKPSGPKNLMPLSSIGLCDALITTPAAARVRRVTQATAGVGTIPSETVSRPTDVMPATMRRLEHRSREARVASDQDRRRSPLRAAGSPQRARLRYASSGVSSLLATPRTPSVPKSRLICSPRAGDEVHLHAHEVRRDDESGESPRRTRRRRTAAPFRRATSARSASSRPRARPRPAPAADVGARTTAELRLRLDDSLTTIPLRGVPT